MFPLIVMNSIVKQWITSCHKQDGDCCVLHPYLLPIN